MAIASKRETLIFKKAERDLLRLRGGYQPDIVHNFRTTTMRLQVLLEDIVPSQNGKRKKLKLLKPLGRIRKRAGRIRDIDVQLAALRSLKVPLEPRRKTQLTQRLIETRHRQEKRLGKLLKKKDLDQIFKRLRRIAKAVELETDNSALDIARRMLASATDGTARLDEDQLHRCRVAVKRTRYAAEFAPKSAETDQFISQLKKLQDALGRWHDWFTLTNTARHEIADIHQSSLVAALHNVTRGKFREAGAALASILATPGKLAVVSRRKQNLKSPAPVAQTGAAA
jgi:CHAD domain-containing protein